MMSKMQYQEYQSKPKYQIILLGKTGSGKSTLANQLSLGEHNNDQKIFSEGDKIFSCTTDCKSFISHFKGIQSNPLIKTIDTPGFMDTNNDDLQNIAKICQVLKNLTEGFNIIYYVYPATEFKFDQSLQTSFKFLGMVMGQAVYEHVSLVVTKMDILNEQEQEKVIDRFEKQIIPAIKNKLKLKVQDKVIYYKHNDPQDGLDDVLVHLRDNEQRYIPEVMEDIKQMWDENNPYDSAQKLLENSKIFQELRMEFQKEREAREKAQKALKEMGVQIEKMSENHSQEMEKQRKMQQQEQEAFRRWMQESSDKNQKMIADLQQNHQQQVQQYNQNLQKQIEEAKQSHQQNQQQYQNQVYMLQSQYQQQIQAAQQEHTRQANLLSQRNADLDRRIRDLENKPPTVIEEPTCWPF